MLKNITFTILTLTAVLLILGCEPERPLPKEPAKQPESPAPSEVEQPDKTEQQQQVTIIEPDTNKPQETEPHISTEKPVEPEIAESSSEPLPAETQQADIFNIKFAPIFETYVDEKGMANYSSLRRQRMEIGELLSQVASLKTNVYEKWPAAEKIAFWINIYNLKMLDIIIDNYPIESTRIHRLFWPTTSIRHIPPRNEVGSPKWNDNKLIVMDEEFTLYEIENRFFREQFNDPRIFLALSMASIDGPPLLNEPYLGQKLNEQLDDQSGRFVNSPSGLQIDRSDSTVYLSAIFEDTMPWYGNEFLKKYPTDKKFKSQSPAIRAVLNFATNYLPPNSVDYLETGNYSVRYKAFDWRLNDQQ